MARKPMITRTIKITKVNAMCVDTVNAEICNQVYTLSGTFDDDEKLLAIINKDMEESDLKAVTIVEKTVEEKLFGMEEEKFIQFSKELPPRTTKTDESAE